MSIALQEEHEQLSESVARWMAQHAGRDVVRGCLDAEQEPQTPGWQALGELGWLGLHVPEPAGSGFGLLEACIVVEQAGRAMLPGPLLPTLLLSALLARAADPATLLVELAEGRSAGTVAWRAGELDGAESAGGVVASGTLRPVLCAGGVPWLLAPVRVGSERRWYLLETSALEVSALPSLDLTRRVSQARAREVELPAARHLAGVTDEDVDAVGALLLSAEAAGMARWCTDTAAAYANVRVQFGHVIGHFQAVKHSCADMLVRAEQAVAVSWDAAVAADGDADRAQVLMAAQTAASVAPAAAFKNAKACIQVLGGIGFTWEHDAQLYLRRATAVRALLGTGDEWALRVTRQARAGVRRERSLELPPEAQALREQVRREVAELVRLAPDERRRALALGGWLAPHLAAPAGRGAGPLEELVIAQELAAAGVELPHLEIGAWALPTLLEHGTPEQRERWVEPTLLGDVRWCQLFSEPGAGSDLAGLTTTATPVDGGYLVNGQKVWTSMATDADLGLLLARTSPDLKRHRGISYFVLDMRSPGVDVRPLRELTGEAFFSEVFLSDVLLPPGALLGELHGGWAVARSTLAAERVVISAGTSYGGGLDALLQRAPTAGAAADADVRLGRLVVEAQTVALLGLRSTSRALTGSLGAEAAVRKLVGVQNEQGVLELGLDALGPEGTHLSEGDSDTWVRGFLNGRCLTIAGGTSEVQRNVIAERLLGLPRDVGY